MNEEYPIIFDEKQVEKYTLYLEAHKLFDQAYRLIKKYKDNDNVRKQWYNLVDKTFGLGIGALQYLAVVRKGNDDNERLIEEETTLKQMLDELVKIDRPNDGLEGKT